MLSNVSGTLVTMDFGVRYAYRVDLPRKCAEISPVVKPFAYKRQGVVETFGSLDAFLAAVHYR